MALNGKPVIALVPARGGSKGVIGKNMRLVRGTPLVGYTLQAALKSQYITEVYLSSDDEQTLFYGQEIGVSLVRRPNEYSSDTASANSVVEHCLTIFAENLIEQDPYIVYLQPTSPLRTSEHIDDALRKMAERGLHKLISVVEMAKSPFKAFVLDEYGTLRALFEERVTNHRRQDLPKVYLPNGAIYIFRISDFRDQNAFPSNGSYPYIMCETDSLDIDTLDDFKVLDRIIDEKYT